MGAAPAEKDPAAPRPGRLTRIFQKIWWLHSGFALSFGVGVMLFARAGLAHADKVMIALFASWLLLFVALRFIVGPDNRKEQETIARKGVRVATNYIIKQFYQQMFFFLTPLYASSATWSFASWNWWLTPILLVCGVLSTMDLVFDHFVMERRWLASLMYGFAMFGLLNVLLPLVVECDHATGLIVAGAATPAMVALLTFNVRQVLSPQGAILTLAMTGGLLGAVWYGRAVIPPAPLAMPETAVGHGGYGELECMPGSSHQIRIDQLALLRCGSFLREPGGLKEPVVHVWLHAGHELSRQVPTQVQCDGDGVVFRSEFDQAKLPANPVGTWACETWTKGGQLVGLRKFEVVTKDGKTAEELAARKGSATQGSGSGSGSN